MVVFWLQRFFWSIKMCCPTALNEVLLHDCARRSLYVHPTHRIKYLLQNKGGRRIFFVKLTVNCDTNRLSALSAFDCWLLRSLVWTSIQYHSPACVVCMFERAALVILLRSYLDCDAVREELCSQEASMCLEMACTEIEFWGLCMWACFSWALCSVGRSRWCSVRVLYF